MKKIRILCLSLIIAVSTAACTKKVESIPVVKSNESTVTDKDTSQDNSTQVSKDLKDQNTTEDKNESKTTQEQPSNNATQSKNTTAQASNTTSSKTSTTQQTSQVKNNKVIVIDPGHANRSNLEKEPIAPGSSELKIKDGGGAQGVVTRTPEYQVNMKVSLILKQLLESKGYTVIMTKTQDSQSLGNVERAEIGNNANAALVIRIHADSADSSAAKGASMLVPAAINDNTKAIYASSKSYGQTVLSTLIKEVGMYNRGEVERNDMTGFNWSKVPVILVEMGFLSNPDEDRLLSTSDYQNKLAKGLADGIAEAVK